jgi:hypothetical protein
VCVEKNDKIGFTYRRAFISVSRRLQERFDMFSEKRLLSRLIRLAFLLSACTICLFARANLSDGQAGNMAAKPVADSLQQLRLSYSFKLAEKEDDCVDEESTSGVDKKPMAATSNRDKSMDGVLIAALSNTSKNTSAKDAIPSSKTSQQDSAKGSATEKSSPQVWEISPTDKTLNAALARWTAIAGWQLSWELPVDYSVEVKTVVPGTFEEAVELVTKSMDTAEIPIKAIFYSGNKVLRIVQKGTK